MLKARCELDMPAIPAGSLNDWSEPVRTQFEDRYVEALRHVGSRLLAAGDILGAWPYFRMLGEKEPVAAALDAYQPTAGDEAQDRPAHRGRPRPGRAPPAGV